jgi:glycerate 2-kinase
MKIVLAPDSFKGSLDAAEVCAALTAGIHAVDPGHQVISHPLADGGEGTLQVLASHGATLHDAVVQDSWGTPVTASFALWGSTAVIESAQSFAFREGATPADALGASSAGVGELILAALKHSPHTVIIYVGGTSGTDAGIGMLQALGARALNADGAPVPPGGAGLQSLAHWDCSGLDSRLAGVSIVVATDVTNPLLGAEGAARVFAPQKGADPAGVEILEAGLSHAAQLMGSEFAAAPGSGAGGGLGFGALAALGARRESGARLLGEMTRFEDALQGADLVITGEGSFDEQSLRGKITGAVIDLASKHDIPVVVVCGVASSPNDEYPVEVVAISEGAASREESMANARSLVEAAGSRIARGL